MFFRSIKHHWHDSHIQVHVAVFFHVEHEEKSLQNDNETINQFDQYEKWHRVPSWPATERVKIYICIILTLFVSCLVISGWWKAFSAIAAIIGYVCNVNILIVGVCLRGRVGITFIKLIEGFFTGFFVIFLFYLSSDCYLRVAKIYM